MAYEDEVIADAPLVYYKGQEASGDLIDEMANIDATANGSPTYQAQGFLRSDSDFAVDYDAAGDYHQAQSTIASFGANAAWTIEFLIAMTDTSLGSSDFGEPIELDGTWQIIFSGASAGFGQPTRKMGFIQQGVGFYWNGGITWSAGVDYHVVYKRAASSSDIEVWVDGVLDHTITVSSGAMGLSQFRIGRNMAGARMAHVAVYDYELSDGRIADHYNAIDDAAAPGNSVPPAVTGAAVVGQTLTSDDGTWSGTPTSFAYQWESSPDGVSSWTPIGGETANTYDVVTGDIGDYLRCVVTASNADGDTDEPSNVVGPVIPHGTGPVEVAAFDGDHSNGYSPTTWTPDTSGVLAGDYMLATFVGAFTMGLGAITLPDGWETIENDVVLSTGRAAVFGKLSYEDTPTEVFTFPSAASFVGTLTVVRGGFNAGTPITDYGKTTDNSLATVTYDGNDLVVAMTLGTDTFNPANVSAIPAGFTDVIEEAVSTATVSGWLIDVAKLEATVSDDTSGLSFSYSVGSDFYTLAILFEYDPGEVPEVTVDPVVSGTLRVNEVLSCTEGTWTFSPSSFSYDWERSADGSTGWANVGTDADTYTIDVADEGYYFRCLVTATNGDGDSTPAPSNVVGPADPYPTITRFTVSG